MNSEVYEMYRRNFPYISRNQDTVRNILENEANVVFEKRNAGQTLVGCAIVNENTILLLVVDEAYRHHGIGSELLKLCENEIREHHHDSIVLGVGFDYLMPGVPTSKKYADSVHENLNPLVNEDAAAFFEKRGYVHAWKDCNCFDMTMALRDFTGCPQSVGDTVNGIVYQWAVREDLPDIIVCVDDACQYQDESFSVYYKNPDLYRGDEKQRVLTAKKNGKIVGTLIVTAEEEEKDRGNVGCTCVLTAEGRRGIGTNLVRLGTKYLKELGLSYAGLNYTYSGLDKLYGEAGYQISTYYFMGEKKLRKQVV